MWWWGGGGYLFSSAPQYPRRGPRGGGRPELQEEVGGCGRVTSLLEISLFSHAETLLREGGGGGCPKNDPSSFCVE